MSDLETKPKVDFKVTLTADNVADIVAVKQEGEWLSKEKALQETLQTLDEKKHPLQEQFEQEMKETAKIEKKKLEDFFKNSDWDLAVEGCEVHQDDKNRVLCVASISGESSWGRDSFRPVKKATLSSKAKQINQEISKINKEIEKTKKDLIKVRKDLGNIERLRRLASAKIGLEALEGTEEGRKMLKQLGISDIRKLLPGS